jgi:hypothetical protein
MRTEGKVAAIGMHTHQQYCDKSFIKKEKVAKFNLNGKW